MRVFADDFMQQGVRVRLVPGAGERNGLQEERVFVGRGHNYPPSEILPDYTVWREMGREMPETGGGELPEPRSFGF
jgi:hypothetical protein